MDNKINLSIIIVSWNVKDLLQKCLNSIYENSRGFASEVFVVDNASADGSSEMVKNNFPEVKLIENKKNLGFAKANNLAIKQSRGEYVLLLNPDTEIMPGSLDNMINFMESKPNCGIAGCKILNPDGTLQKSVRKFPSLYSEIIILLKLHNLSPKLIKNYLALDFDYNKCQIVDQVMGAFFMINKKVIDKIGLLDEKFYIWFEEVDFCKRAKNAGFKILYTPDVAILHYGAQSFKQVLSLRKQKIFNKSLVYYFKKHHSYFLYLIIKILSPVSLFLAFLVNLFYKNKH